MDPYMKEVADRIEQQIRDRAKLKASLMADFKRMQVDQEIKELKRVRAEVLAGNYKTLVEVEEALQSAEWYLKSIAHQPCACRRTTPAMRKADSDETTVNSKRLRELTEDILVLRAQVMGATLAKEKRQIHAQLTRVYKERRDLKERMKLEAAIKDGTIFELGDEVLTREVIEEALATALDPEARKRDRERQKRENELLAELVSKKSLPWRTAAGVYTEEVLADHVDKIDRLIKAGVPNRNNDVYTEEVLADQADEIDQLADEYYRAGRRIGKDFSEVLLENACKTQAAAVANHRTEDLMRKTKQRLNDASPEELVKPRPIGKILAIIFGLAGIVFQGVCLAVGAPGIALSTGLAFAASMLLFWGVDWSRERRFRQAVCRERIFDFQDAVAEQLNVDNDDVMLTPCSEKQFVKGRQTKFVVAINEFRDLAICPSGAQYDVEGGRFMEEGRYLAVTEPDHLRFTCACCKH